jgi:hypothetical protein
VWIKLLLILYRHGFAMGGIKIRFGHRMTAQKPVVLSLTLSRAMECQEYPRSPLSSSLTRVVVERSRNEKPTEDNQ